MRQPISRIRNMHPGGTRRPLSALLVGVLAATGLVAVALGAGPMATSASAATNQFKGVNWADPRDNYADENRPNRTD